jgi:hypothetical protein
MPAVVELPTLQDFKGILLKEWTLVSKIIETDEVVVIQHSDSNTKILKY